jgi:HD superfamily phosphodiesterase
MIEADAIRKRARQDLVITTAQGQEDVRVWEHSLRVTDVADQLADLPELAGQQVDHVVLAAVGMYHEAGWIVQHLDGIVPREALLARPTSPLQRELGASLAERSLAGVMPRHTVDAVASCIRLLGDREVGPIEARLVAEADSLDEFGALGLWKMARKNNLEGKGLAAAIETWATQKQYGYWTARINDAFRFDSVRRVAQERLKILDRMMRELRAHHTAEDLMEALGRQTAAQA